MSDTVTEITVEEILANRARWAEALRSGDYEQTDVGAMCHNGRYCCLGVARALLNPPESDADWGGFADSRTTAELGLSGNAGGTAVLDGDGEMVYLSDLNDVFGFTFAEIADLIDDGQVLLNTDAGA
jgi:hypothetical protein